MCDHLRFITSFENTRGRKPTVYESDCSDFRDYQVPKWLLRNRYRIINKCLTQYTTRHTTYNCKLPLCGLWLISGLFEHGGFDARRAWR